MKVEIKHSEEKGFLGKIKGYRVWLGVTFSEEEKAIVKAKNLGKTLWAEWQSDSRFKDMPLSIGSLVKEGTHAETFQNPIAAQECADYYKDKMKVLKSFIDASGRDQQNESFEL